MRVMRLFDTASTVELAYLNVVTLKPDSEVLQKRFRPLFDLNQYHLSTRPVPPRNNVPLKSMVPSTAVAPQ
jgi:hypothetical protein